MSSVAARIGLLPSPRQRVSTEILSALLICGVLSALVYIAGDVAAAMKYPGYSYTDQAVSELFAIGAPTSGLVVLLFTVSSALGLAFAIGIWLSDRGAARRWLAAMLTVSAVNSILLWNFFPMHMRGAERSMTDTMHLVLAANPYWLLSLIFGAVAFRGAFRVYTVATTALLLALAAYGFSFVSAVQANAATPWMGLAERGAQYADGIWQTVLAIMLWRSHHARAS